MDFVRLDLGAGKSILVEARPGKLSASEASYSAETSGSSLDALIMASENETDSSRSALSKKLTSAAEQTLKDTLSTISPMIDAIHDAVASVTRPVDAIEISFGIKITAGAQAILSAGTEANIEFKVSWKLDEHADATSS